MTLLEDALFLASKHFYVFPLKSNSKFPQIEEWQDHATHDVEKIKEWWTKWPDANIGIYTGKYNGGKEALLAVDVDVKDGKRGDLTLIQKEMEGMEFPPTFTQTTPTGGKHLIYKVKEAVKQGVDVFGPGLDVRSRGGYLVGAGSIINGEKYSCEGEFPIESPHDLITTCGIPREKKVLDIKAPVDIERAKRRAKHYLLNEAPLAIYGAGGDNTTYVVACHMKDFGLELIDAVNIMLEHWNDRCSPPWGSYDLRTKVENAYRYGNDPAGIGAPELLFEELPVEETKLSPVQELNKQFAFIIVGGGGYVLREFKDMDGHDAIDFLNIPSFNQLIASQTLMTGNGKVIPMSTVWMKSPERRTYQGLCFLPGKPAPKGYYNLWKGFTVPAQAPITKEGQQAFDLYLSHVKENICENNPMLFDWVVSYLAHLIQKPWEKPRVALVLRGRKGVGKNVFIERFGDMIKSNFLVVSNQRYLSGNFNAHLERLLMVVFDEAFWSGDKKAEGTLKDLITGANHLIERKGKEPYTVKNCTRVIILGNEDWLVPATQDERRFAVLDVGESKMKDSSFFGQINKGMKAGGNTILFNYLMNYKSNCDINVAPSTKALTSQKTSSLHPLHQFWFESLKEGRLVQSDFGIDWQTELNKERFRSAFRRYMIERKIDSRLPHEELVSKLMRQVLPKISSTQKRTEEGRARYYIIPPLEEARKNWESFIGDTINWEE